MINGGIGCFNPAKRLARMAPLTAGRLARRFAKAADPRQLLQPVAGGWLSLLLLFNPRRRSSSASRPVSATTSARSNPFSARNASITASPPTAGVTPSREAVSSAGAIDTLNWYSAVTCQ